MKKLYFMLASLCVLSFSLQSQVLVNPGFESWEDVDLFSEPTEFATSNIQSVFEMSDPTVIKSTDSYEGEYAARLKAQEDSYGDIIPAMLMLGTFDPDMGFDFVGIPWTDVPESVSLWVRHDIAEGDTAEIMFMFTASDEPVGSASFELTGNSDGYVQVDADVTWFGSAPDMLVFLATSTSLDFPNLASEVYIDDIVFDYGKGGGEAFPNGDFEEWIDYAYEEPEGWSTSNFMHVLTGASVTKSDDAYQGDWSARIESMELPFSEDEDQAFGYLIRGDIPSTGDDASGVALNGEVPTEINFHYKYAPMAENDSAAVYVLMTKWNSTTMQKDTISEGMRKMPPTNTWTEYAITMPEGVLDDIIESGIYPDSIFYGFVSSDIIALDGENNEFIPEPGSVLFVDNLSYSAYTHVSKLEKLNMTLYPVPANNQLNIRTDKTIKSVDIFDIQGRSVISYTNNEWMVGSIDVQDLPIGNYVVRMHVGDQYIIRKFSIMR